jgi:cation transport regulator ChaC
VDRTGAIRTGDEAPRIARLHGWRLAFNKRGASGEVYANIAPASSGEVVIGVVYRWDEESRKKMARREGGYAQAIVEVLTDAGDRLKAVTFIAQNTCEEGQPSSDYLDTIVRGARQHGLPEEYIEQVMRLAGGQSKGRRR